jgi:NAD-dependent dihydropyrimidine dehydrogenase PreA subunit
MIRTVVSIDERLCNGCGECVPACEEGAIRIIDGKARLLSDRLCDGLGACLGHCPQGAIQIERREAAPFDEAAVRRNLTEVDATARQISQLTHWPVQLRLLPATAPVLRGAHLLVAADCVPVAYAGFHSELLRGRVVAIGCPKLDDLRGYVEARGGDPAQPPGRPQRGPHGGSVLHGILRAVLEARRLAASDLPSMTSPSASWSADRAETDSRRVVGTRSKRSGLSFNHRSRIDVLQSVRTDHPRHRLRGEGRLR